MATDIKLDSITYTLSPGVKPLGAYANCFRVLLENDGEAVIDFSLFSNTEKIAEVLSRVRIPVGLLKLMVEKANSILTNPDPTTPPVPTILSQGSGEPN